MLQGCLPPNKWEGAKNLLCQHVWLSWRWRNNGKRRKGGSKEIYIVKVRGSG
jgi:hypothetical protein